MIKIRTERVVSVQDWDELVEKTYKRPYCFQQQDGCKERQRVYINVPTKHPMDFEAIEVPEEVNHPDMGVSFAAWLERDPDKMIKSEHGFDFTKMWWHRNFYPDVEMIINDLYSKGLLPEGELTIDIDW
jgi:hypothetical protein